MPLILPVGFIGNRGRTGSGGGDDPDPEGYKSFLFDGVNDYLALTWGSTATSTHLRAWTLSFWVKTSAPYAIFITQNAGGTSYLYGYIDPSGYEVDQTSGLFQEGSSGLASNTWQHWTFAIDTTESIALNRVRVFRDGSFLTPSTNAVTQNTNTVMFTNGYTLTFMSSPIDNEYVSGRIAFIDMVSGNSLPPVNNFAQSIGGVWTRIPYTGSRGTWGFSLDGSDGTNDVSGNGFHFSSSGGLALDADLPPYQD